MYLTYKDLLCTYPQANLEAIDESKLNDFEDDCIGDPKIRITASGVYNLLTPKFKIADNDISRGYIIERALKAQGVKIPQASSAATRWGNDNEVIAIDSYNLLKNSMFIHNKVVYTGSKESEYGKNIACVPDAICPKDLIIAQIKCPFNPVKYHEYRKIKSQLELKILVPQYYCQVQFEMFVMGNKVYLFFLTQDSQKKSRYMKLLCLLIMNFNNYLTN